MSLRRKYDRTVVITPRNVAGSDDRGNDVIADGEPFSARAAREVVDSAEETLDRDQQTQTFRYFVDPFDPITGDEIVITGYDRLGDEERTFEILGAPEVVRRSNRGRAHHVELVARRTGVPAP